MNVSDSFDVFCKLLVNIRSRNVQNFFFGSHQACDWHPDVAENSKLLYSVPNEHTFGPYFHKNDFSKPLLVSAPAK